MRSQLELLAQRGLARLRLGRSQPRGAPPIHSAAPHAGLPRLGGAGAAEHQPRPRECGPFSALGPALIQLPLLCGGAVLHLLCGLGCRQQGVAPGSAAALSAEGGGRGPRAAIPSSVAGANKLRRGIQRRVRRRRRRRIVCKTRSCWHAVSPTRTCIFSDPDVSMLCSIQCFLGMLCRTLCRAAMLSFPVQAYSGAA